MDFDGEVSKTGVVEVMLREMSRDTVQTLKSVKQTERFLHLDSWSAQHSEEEQPPRVVGFFPSNQTKGYGGHEPGVRIAIDKRPDGNDLNKIAPEPAEHKRERHRKPHGPVPQRR